MQTPIPEGSTNAQYEITVQELARQTSPEDTRILLTALATLTEPSAPISGRIPEQWEGILQFIYTTPPELPNEKARLISIARRVLEHNLEAPLQPSSDEQSGSPFDTMSQPLLHGFISEYLPPQSQAALAQTSRGMREAVKIGRAQQGRGFVNEPGLAALLSYFCSQPIDAQNFRPIMNDLLNKILPNVLLSFRNSSTLSEDEKSSFLAHSPEAIANDPSLLRQVLRAAYDNSLVELVGAIERPQVPLPDLRAASSLKEKAQITREWLKANEESVTTISINQSRPGTVTCLPEEICRLTKMSWLTIENQLIHRLPASIGTLRELRRLTISDSRLSSLPPEIGTLQNLDSLDLKRNQLSTLPQEIGDLPRLRTLYVKGNPHIFIPESILSKTKLDTLQ